MRATLKLFLDFIRKPEWVAAVALLIQAVILWLQARILHKHGETMKEHAEVAKDQAKTAELIGKALEQHAMILGEQAKITEAQFKFQRRIEIHAARERVYDQLLELHSSLLVLIATIESPGERYPPRVAEELVLQSQASAALTPALKAVLTSPYLTTEEKDYLKQFLTDLSGIVSKPLQGKVGPLKEFVGKYHDIVKMIVKIGRSPEDQDSLRA